mmetsp:Transcript_4644/g.11665  ORF Transcript_4644/g.11665 Transcript_4644/m.11665 type:complete len:294 (-) Transcript_4644:128-1009(-)
MPVFAEFQAEDWIMMGLRFELSLLVHAFKRDANDPERTGIHIEHLGFYYQRYYRKVLEPRTFGVDSLERVVELVKDTLYITKQQVVETLLPDEMESYAVIAQLTEEARRSRVLAVDAGDESARLHLQMKAIGGGGGGGGGGRHYYNQGKGGGKWGGGHHGGHHSGHVGGHPGGHPSGQPGGNPGGNPSGHPGGHSGGHAGGHLSGREAGKDSSKGSFLQGDKGGVQHGEKGGFQHGGKGGFAQGGKGSVPQGSKGGGLQSYGRPSWSKGATRVQPYQRTPLQAGPVVGWRGGK